MPDEMKYRPLTTRFAKWLFPLIDRYDWGFRDRDGKPKSVNPDWLLDIWYTKQFDKKFPAKITKTHIESHLNGTDMLYYRSQRGSGFVLLMIDIDAKTGEPDAGAVAQFLADTYFPGAYYEVSPGGRGRHLYLVVRCQVKRESVNADVVKIAKALNAVVAAKGFKAKIDRVNGSFTILNPNKTIRDRGSFGKIPRLPRGEADLDRLASSPVFLSSVFNKLFEHTQGGKGGVVVPLRETYPVTVLPVPVKGVEKRKGRNLSESEGFRTPQPRNPNDARSRMNAVVRALALKDRRLPSVEETLTAYQAQYPQHQNDEPAARRKRAEEQIKHVAKVFDVTKTQQTGFKLKLYLPLIQKHVTSEHRNPATLCYKKQITDEDLAIALHVIERGSFTTPSDPYYLFTCPWKSIQGMFQTLKNAGDTKRGCNKPKAICLRQILERAQLTETIDKKWVSGDWLNRGRGQRIVVGLHHPRRQEWERLRQSMENKTASKRKTKKVA